MGLRDKLEEKQAVKTERETAEQATREAEQKEAARVAAEQFQKTFQDRASITEALESFRSTAQGVEEGMKARQEKAGSVKGLIKKLKEVEPEDTTTFREAVSGANDEEKQGVGDSEEAEYFSASKSLKDQRQAAQAARENLRNLGIEAEGQSEIELAEAARRISQEKTQELRSYVREHPEFESPEAEEVRSEMIKEIQDDLINRAGNLRDSTAALRRSLAEFRGRIGSKENTSDEQKERLLSYVSQDALQNYMSTQDAQILINELAKDSKIFQKAKAGEIETQALANVLRMKLVGMSLNYKGEYDIDPIYSGEVSQSRREMEFFLKDDEGNIPENFQYDDKSGLTKEGILAFYEKMDDPAFNRYAERLIEIAKKQERVNKWEEDNKATAERIDTIRDKQARLERQKRELQEGIDYNTKTTIPNAVAKRDFLMSFPVKKAELLDEKEESVEYSRGGMLLFPGLTSKREEIKTAYKGKIATAEEERQSIESAIAAIQAEKDGLFKGNVESKKTRTTAETENLRLKRLEISQLHTDETEAIGQLNDKYNKISEILKPYIDQVYPDSFKGTLREFLAKLSEKVEGSTTSLEETLSALEQDNQVKRSEIEGINTTLGELSTQIAEERRNLDGFDYRNKQRVIEDIASLRSSLSGR